MKNTGFTLIELLVVIAIIAMLTAIGLPNFVGARQKAKDSQLKQELTSLKSALRMYYNDNQAYPPGADCGNCLETPLQNYFPAVASVGYTYSQTNSGDGFLLTVGLGDGAGDDDVISQVKCGVGVTVDKVFAVCLN